MLKGWRTILGNVALVVGTEALKSLAGVDWVAAVGPVWAMGIVAAINIGFRYITNTAIGQSK